MMWGQVKTCSVSRTKHDFLGAFMKTSLESTVSSFLDSICSLYICVRAGRWDLIIKIIYTLNYF